MPKDLQPIRSGDKIAPLTRSFSFDRASINENDRTIPVVFSTETDKVERWFGREILDHSPKSVRLDRLNNAAPLLLDHDSREQIGVIESASIGGKRGQAVVRFSKSAKGEEVYQDVLDGIRSKISVGYRIHSAVLESETDGVPTYRINDWEPFEVSLVAIPADDDAGIRADESSLFGKRSAELSTTIQIENSTNTDMTEDTTPTADETRSEKPPVTVPVSAPVKTEAVKPDPDAERQRAAEIQGQVTAELERRSEIEAIAKQFGIDADATRKAIADKSDVDSFKRQVLDHLAARNPAFTATKTMENETKKGTRAHTIEVWGRSAAESPSLKGRVEQMPVSNRDLPERRYLDGDGQVFHRSLTGAVTLLDVAQLDAGIGTPIIDETIIEAPEVGMFPVEIISGSTVELSVQTDTPTVGFRNANEGRDFVRGTFASKIFQTQVIEQPIAVDIQGVLNASKNPGRVLMAEAMNVTKAVLNHIGVQTWYAGTAQASADAKAPPGIIAQAETGNDHVYDAQGGSAKSSVWFLQLGEQSLCHIYGNDTTLNYGANWVEETIEDANSKKLRALVNWISGRVAVKLANKNAAVRIKNLAAATQVLTDAILFSGLELCDNLGLVPNVIVMNPRSLYQLRNSRTATNPVGAPAPLPMEWNGIPILKTKNISIAETV
jgi:HK97 family phage prohead protease